MRDERTPEQLAADAALAQAIDGVRIAYEMGQGDDGQIEYLNDYVVVFATVKLDGSESSTPGMLFNNGVAGMPEWKIRGLLTTALEVGGCDCD